MRTRIDPVASWLADHQPEHLPARWAEGACSSRIELGGARGLAPLGGGAYRSTHKERERGVSDG